MTQAIKIAATGRPPTEEMLQLASQLRHQMAEDVGTAHAPRLHYIRPRPDPAVPTVVTGRSEARRGTWSLS